MNYFLLLIIIVLILLLVKSVAENGDDRFIKGGSGTMLLTEENIREKNEQLYVLMNFLDDTLNDNNIRYVVDTGTLLGAYRDQKAIPYDNDIDILVHKDDWSKFKELIKTYNKDIYKFTFNRFIDPKGQLMGLQIKTDSKFSNEVHADIQKSNYNQPWLVKKFNQFIVGVDRPPTDTHWIFNESLTRLKFGPLEVWAPSSKNIEKYLEELYGDWKTPRRG